MLLVDSPGSVQTYFWLGNVGVDQRYSGRPALDLVNTLYGGRFTSILNTELRIKSGLSYGASSGFVRGTVPGEFAIRFVHADREHRQGAGSHAADTLEQAQARSARAGDARIGARLRARPVSAAARNRGALGRRRSRTWSSTVSARTTSKAMARRSAKVDLAETAAVTADAFPRPTDLLIVLIGDAAKIREMRREVRPGHRDEALAARLRAGAQ